ncbi:DUF1499 domain-containing protein [Parvularcula dongshanensis]|uniref:DUF1499 domain-containing protein n=1 Tax=Parvularcula dongshanensis TaxID=1173995 RepID=A0A840I4X3_9PROT|nr:DUF1499 domain-containing protein [Parvularcula dongshanensis]MBB4659254.1 hypothetical protein [Parvularcula dongshanensis]
MSETRGSRRDLGRDGLVLVLLGLAPVVIYAVLTLGFRTGLLGLGIVFGSFSWIVPFLLAGGVAALFGGALMLWGRTVFAGLVGVLVGVAAIGMGMGPTLLRQKAGTVPPIHDISTDTQNPPAFVAILPLREGAPNPAAYDPGQTAQQLEAYPDVKTLIIERPYAEAFPIVVKALRGEGLDLVATVPAEGRIEAVATTRWFGFKDDVVVRLIDAHGIATVVDIRSKSRIGRSDVGANAERIRAISERIVEASS